MSPAPSSHRLAVSSVRDETPIDRTLTLPLPAGAEAEFRFVPGQVVHLHKVQIPGGELGKNGIVIFLRARL